MVLENNQTAIPLILETKLTKGEIINNTVVISLIGAPNAGEILYSYGKVVLIPVLKKPKPVVLPAEFKNEKLQFEKNLLTTLIDCGVTIIAPKLK